MDEKPGGPCKYIHDEWCEWRHNIHACRKVPAIVCRNRREQIEKDRSKDV